MTRSKVMIPLLLAGCCVALWAQDLNRMTSQDTMSGATMYQMYCGSCHGVDGKGKGPVAPVLKTRVPDLTLLSKNSGGKFPLMKVEQTISGDIVFSSHGSREMPIYGDMFRDIKRDETFVKQRVGLLSGYIESLQRK